MDEEKEWKGNWFLPNFPEDKVSGTLKYSPSKGVYLELIGKRFLNSIKEDDILLGDVPNSTQITLLNCSRLSLWSSPNQNFYVNSFLIGHHFYNRQDLKFDSVVLSSKQFDEWFHIGSLDHEEKYSDDGILQASEFRYKYKDPIVFNIDSNVEGTISTHLNPKFEFSDVLTLKEYSTLKIDSEEKINVFELEKIARSFVHFVQLCYFEVVFFEEMIFTSNDILRKRHKKQFPKEIKFYRKQHFIDEKIKVKYHFENLTNYDQLRGNFKPLIENWYKLRDKLRPVTNILVYDLEPKMWTENDFLNMAQGVESFHKRFRYDEERDFLNKKDRIIYEKILKSLNNQNYERWLKKFFEKKKMLTKYKDRIGDILSELDYDIMNSIYQDKDDFIELVTINRHYYSHLDIDKEDEILDNQGLFELYVKLKVILTILVFKELKLNEDNMLFLIDRLIDQHSAVLERT